MKVRNSFVTNSSSSSFILALKDGATKEELKKDVEKFYDKYKDEIISYLSYYEPYEEDLENTDQEEKNIISALKTKNSEVIKDKVVNFLLGKFLYFFEDTFYSPKKLGNWKVGIEECSNEDGEIFSDLMYQVGGNFEGENLKMI